VDQNLLDSLFDHFIYLMVGKHKHWEEVEPGVWQVKACYSEDPSNPTKLTIKLEGEDYRG